MIHFYFIILRRFPKNEILARFLKIFDNRNYPSIFNDYGKDEVRWLLNFFKFPDEEEKAVDIWSGLRHSFKQAKDDTNTSIRKILDIILKEGETTGLTYLAKYVLMVPATSVCNERGFSILRINKSYMRTCVTD